MARGRGADLDATSVWKAMTPEPPTATDNDSIASALRTFRAQQLDHLCILRQDGSPFGILDMSTLVDWMSKQLTVIVFEGVAAG
jgi:CBS domain-containing protein